MPETKRVIVIEGERIYFSPLDRRDLDTYTRWFSNLELSAYLGRVGSFATAEDEKAWMEDALVSKPNIVHFAIIEKATDQLLGTVSLMDINHRNNIATLGISIGEPSTQGRGYGTEAVRLMVEYGFFFHNLWNIKLWHVDFNTRGHQAYLRAGFKEVGRVRGAIVIGGERFDNVLMDITREDVDLKRMRAIIKLMPQ